MVTVLNSRASGPGSSPGQGHCVVFLGKTLYSKGASHHLGVQMRTSQFNAWGNPGIDLASPPGRSRNTRSCFMLQKME